MAVFLNHQTHSFGKFSLILPLGPQILPQFEDSKIDLDVVDDITVSNTHPWTLNQSEPHVCLSTTFFFFFKDCTNCAIHEQAFLEITSENQNHVQILLTAPNSMSRLLLQQ